MYGCLAQLREAQADAKADDDAVTSAVGRVAMLTGQLNVDRAALQRAYDDHVRAFREVYEAADALEIIEQRITALESQLSSLPGEISTKRSEASNLRQQAQDVELWAMVIYVTFVLYWDPLEYCPYADVVNCLLGAANELYDRADQTDTRADELQSQHDRAESERRQLDTDEGNAMQRAQQATNSLTAASTAVDNAAYKAAQTEQELDAARDALREAQNAKEQNASGLEARRQEILADLHACENWLNTMVPR